MRLPSKLPCATTMFITLNAIPGFCCGLYRLCKCAVQHANAPHDPDKWSSVVYLLVAGLRVTLNPTLVVIEIEQPLLVWVSVSTNWVFPAVSTVPSSALPWQST